MSGLHVVIGAGVLGRAIASDLLAAGQMVRIVSRRGTALGAAEALAVDVMQAEGARAACRGASVVYQCAAPAYHQWARDFSTLQENILQGAASASAVLVVAENLYGYGVAGTLTESLPLQATTRKGRVRAAMSRRLFDAHARGEVQAVAGRASDFFGPGVHQSTMGDRGWPRLLSGKPVDWFGDPDQPHSLTYLPDFARALIRLGQEPAAWGRAWHVPSLPARSPREVLRLASRLARRPEPRIRRVPSWLLRAVGLFDPAAGEMVEMGYSFTQPFRMDDSDWRHHFGTHPTDWDPALTATLRYWEG
jgi:nucleoside-diphosphate-sugar epimerase